MYSQPQRIDYLDSIRGLAALAVLLSHSLIFTWPAAVGQILNWPFINMAIDGKAAVAMFFVLSGFVLARPYYISSPGQSPRKLYVPTFYLRRFTRIWLPWLAVFCLSALAQAILFTPWETNPPTNSWFDCFWHHMPGWIDFFRQCIFLEHDAGKQLLIQDWSLGVELKASALLPLFIFLSRWLTPWSLLAVSVPLVTLLPTGHYYVTFILGVLLANASGNVLQWLHPKPFLVKAGLLVTGLVLYGTRHACQDMLDHQAGVKYYWLGTGLGCMLILLASMSSRRIQAALKLRPIMFLGKISYSVYLLQLIVIFCLLPPWIHALNSLGIERAIWLLPLSIIGSVGATVSLSALSYRWIETPCINLGHRLSKKWQEKFLKD